MLHLCPPVLEPLSSVSVWGSLEVWVLELRITSSLSLVSSAVVMPLLHTTSFVDVAIC